jgi:hypothetical protein
LREVDTTGTLLGRLRRDPVGNPAGAGIVAARPRKKRGVEAVSGFAAAGMLRAEALGMAPRASLFVTVTIPVLAALVVAAVGYGVWRFAGARAGSRYAVIALLWLSLAAALGLSGVLSDFSSLPPRIALLMLPTLALPCWLAFSRTGAELAERVPLTWLIGFQGFRLPLELVMHRAAVDGTMPPQMSYTGSNFDIVTGTTALLVALFVGRGRAPRWLLLGWNLLGSGLLVAILAIAIASLPQLAAYGNEPDRVNTWVAYFPFVWLPAGLVSCALLGHLLLWRRLGQRGMRGRALSALS